MKTVTVKNLSIQFDTNDEGVDQHSILFTIDCINDILQSKLLSSSPQILGVDGDLDFEVS